MQRSCLASPPGRGGRARRGRSGRAGTMTTSKAEQPAQSPALTALPGGESQGRVLFSCLWSAETWGHSVGGEQARAARRGEKRRLSQTPGRPGGAGRGKQDTKRGAPDVRGAETHGVGGRSGERTGRPTAGGRDRRWGGDRTVFATLCVEYTRGFRVCQEKNSQNVNFFLYAAAAAVRRAAGAKVPPRPQPHEYSSPPRDPHRPGPAPARPDLGCTALD